MNTTTTTTTATIIVASTALIFGQPDQSSLIPFGLPFWTFWLLGTLFKVCLLVAVAVSDLSVITAALLAVNVLLYRLWNQLVKRGFQTLAMLVMIAISITNASFIVLSFGMWTTIALYIPYAAWCVALLVWNLQNPQQQQQSILPTVASPAPTAMPKGLIPPKIRLFSPLKNGSGGNGKKFGGGGGRSIL